MVQGSRQHRRMPATLHASTQQCLQEYSWPGNIRELKNVVERLVVRDMDRPIEVEDLPEEIRGVFVAATFSTQAGAAPQPQGGSGEERGVGGGGVGGGGGGVGGACR